MKFKTSLIVIMVVVFFCSTGSCKQYKRRSKRMAPIGLTKNSISVTLINFSNTHFDPVNDSENPFWQRNHKNVIGYTGELHGSNNPSRNSFYIK